MSIYSEHMHSPWVYEMGAECVIGSYSRIKPHWRHREPHESNEGRVFVDSIVVPFQPRAHNQSSYDQTQWAYGEIGSDLIEQWVQYANTTIEYVRQPGSPVERDLGDWLTVLLNAADRLTNLIKQSAACYPHYLIPYACTAEGLRFGVVNHTDPGIAEIAEAAVVPPWVAYALLGRQRTQHFRGPPSERPLTSFERLGVE